MSLPEYRWIACCKAETVAPSRCGAFIRFCSYSLNEASVSRGWAYS
jgi:hypothetical protein